MEPTSVMVVGDGPMARHHILAFNAQTETTVTGIVGIDKVAVGNLAREFAIPYYGSSLEAIFDKSRPDIVLVAVSVTAISEVYKTVLELPSLLLFEKPFGLDEKEARSLHELAVANGARAHVALNRRFYSNFRQALAELNHSAGPRMIQILDQQSFDYPHARSWEPYHVQRWMFGNAIHLVDLCRFFARGAIEDVKTSGWEYSDQDPKLISAHIRFSSGDIATYECLWSAPGPWAATVTTQEQRWEMRPLEACRRFLSSDGIWNDIQLETWDRDFKAGLFLQAHNAVRASNGHSHGLVTTSDALASIELLARIYEGYA